MALARNLFLTGMLIAGALIAQTPGPGPLVRISVSATNSDGEPVVDLKADDFKITDQGKAQRVFYFRKDQGIPASTPLAPQEFTNRAVGGTPSPTVILVDLMNQNKTDQLTTWKKLDHDLLKLKTGEGTYFYILTLEGTLLPIHPIDAALSDDKTWPQQVVAPLDKAMKASIHTPPAGLNDEEKVKKTYVALETLGNQLAAFPGRRNIIWITDQVPSVSNPKTTCSGDMVECSLYIPHLSVTLDHANVAVNPVPYSPNPTTSRDMDMLAGLTGGRTYPEQDIDKVVDLVNKEMAGNYTIAYEPAADNWDSKFHRVHVSTDSKVRLLWKQRYYALPDARPAPDRMRAALITAFQASGDTSDIGIRATATPAAGGAKSVHLEIKINPSDVILKEDAGKFAGGLVLLLSDRGANGPLGDPAMSNFNLNLTTAQRAEVLKSGIPVIQDHPLKDGTQKVRIILLDQNSTMVGSLTVPVS